MVTTYTNRLRIEVYQFRPHGAFTCSVWAVLSVLPKDSRFFLTRSDKFRLVKLRSTSYNHFWVLVIFLDCENISWSPRTPTGYSLKFISFAHTGHLHVLYEQFCLFAKRFPFFFLRALINFGFLNLEAPFATNFEFWWYFWTVRTSLVTHFHRVFLFHVIVQPIKPGLPERDRKVRYMYVLKSKYTCDWSLYIFWFGCVMSYENKYYKRARNNSFRS